MHHVAVDDVHKFSLSAIMPVCSTLHSPAPISDTALTLTVYTVPASSPVRIVELAGGDPEMTVSLTHVIVPIPLYCTWNWEMATSLWGMVQVTFKVVIPDTSVLVKETPVTLVGTVQEVLQWNVTLFLWLCMQWVDSIQRQKHQVHAAHAHSTGYWGAELMTHLDFWNIDIICAINEDTLTAAHA